MKKGDFALMILFGAVLAFIIASLVLKPKALYAVVYENREEIARFPMNEDTLYTIHSPGEGENILQIKDGKADIVSANCPNQICVHSAPVSSSGDSIICLPHKISVVLESK